MNDIYVPYDRTSNIELEKSRQLSELREGQENELLVMRQDQLQVERKKRELHQTQVLTMLFYPEYMCVSPTIGSNSFAF